MKNLIKNVIRSFKRNKISILGLIFLLFFGLGVFCVMSNTTANIKNEYTSLAKKGALHDFTASELYEIGDARYEANSKGISYKSSGGILPEYTDWTAFTFGEEGSPAISVDNFYNAPSIATSEGQYYIPIPEVEKIEQDTGILYRRTYKLKLSQLFSTGLYKTFAEQQADTQDVNFSFITTKTPVGVTPEILETLFNYVSDWNAGSPPDPTGMRNLAYINIFGDDYKEFLGFLTTHTQNVFNLMTTTNTPLANYISQNYASEVSYRFFKSLNVTATEDNIFYKIIASDPSDTIDKMVLFNDPDYRSGNNLYSPSEWQPFSSSLVITDLQGKSIEPGHTFEPTATESFSTPRSFNDAAQTPIYSISQIKGWSSDDAPLIKNAYGQILKIRFRRMLAGNTTYPDLIPLLQTLSGFNLTNEQYVQELLEKESSDISVAYNSYLTNYLPTESVTLSANGNVVFSWNIALTPQTCTISNWTSYFSVVNPQHLEKTEKRVIVPSVLNNFKPYHDWYVATYHREPIGEINTARAAEWFNTLTTNQITFWINPQVSPTATMEYYIPDGDGYTTITMTRGSDSGQWNGIDKKYLVECGGYNQVIWGCGLTPDFMYPVVDITRPTPNVATECLVYCNDPGYEDIHLAFINSPTEEYLIAKFRDGISSNRQQTIVDAINTFANDAMIFPDGMKSAYFANDINNMLNCSGYRVSYIPNLVDVVDIVASLLCSFIGILCLVICFVIIKRYVENNRVNIGIMRANGIKKWKIAVSLLPFALFPSIVGGVAAYVTGLLLQAGALTLFSNYWMLPTPLIGFDWVSFLSCVFIPFIIFSLICFLTTLIVLRVSSVELMKPGSEFKTNSFSRIAKKPFKHFGVLTRFRVALAFNSISRLLMLAAMSCLTMSSLVFAFTTFDKLNKSKLTNSTQFDYSFNVQLTTPTAAGGPYSTYEYDQLGLTDPSQYVFNLSWDTTAVQDKEWSTQAGKNNYSQLTKWYATEEGSVLPISIPYDDYYQDAIGKNGNIMMPSSSDIFGKDMDLTYLKNKMSSRLTLDYNIGIPGIASSNPWEIALSLMPSNSRNVAADCYAKLINAVGHKTAEAFATFKAKTKEYCDYDVSDNGVIYYDATWTEARQKKLHQAAEESGKWLRLSWHDIETLDIDEYWFLPFHRFFIYDKDTDTYTLDTSMYSVGYLSSSFNTSFVRLLRTIYTDPEMVKMEYPITYGLVPLNWDKGEDVTPDETYTYVSGYISNLSNGKAFDENEELTIEGIKKDSQYIKLTDKDNHSLNDWLFDSNYLNSLDINEEINPIIVNAYAAHKYDLKVGDTLTLTISNSVDRYEQILHPDKFNADANKVVFKVIGISEGTNGTALYTTQTIANEVIGLPDGKNWNKTHKYMMWSDQHYWGSTPQYLPSVADLAGVKSNNNNIDIYRFVKDGAYSPEPVLDNTVPKLTEVKPPVGFNGIYTKNKSGKPITSGVALYSYTGLYPASSVYKSNGENNQFTNILMSGSNLAVANLMSGIDLPEAYAKNAAFLNSEIDEKAYRWYIENTFIPILTKTFGDTTMITAICGAMDVAASDLIYNNLISTFNLAETSIMAIIIPITIIIVAIISNLIINDSKKMTAMLKALGYSDSKNLMSILALFVPTIVIGLALAVPLSFGLVTAYQSVIFTSANILVDVTQKWWYYVAALGSIGLILLSTYAIGYVSLKKDRLVDQIK